MALHVGLLAQLVERLVYTENVGGSSPSRPTIFLSGDLIWFRFLFGISQLTL